MNRKTFLCIFSLVFSSFSRKNVYEKRWRNKRVILSKQKVILFLPQQNNSKESPPLFLENEEKTSEKYREMFSYQFVAHMPKVRQICAKIKNCPKFDIDW